MNRGLRMEPDRAKAIGRMLYQKYDTNKRGSLQPRQCYEVFSDFCYRILSISSPPTMEQADSMHQVLDANHDKRVTEQDFENLALRYLCGQGNSNRFQTRTSTTITISREVKNEPKVLTVVARKRLDVVRRLFKMFDKDNSGFLTEQEIPLMLKETYKDINPNYSVTGDDVKSYMRLVDTDGNGKVTLDEFETIVLASLEKAGIKIYE